MRIDRRWLLAAGLVVGISFLVGVLASWQMPKLRAFIMVQIEQVSRDHLPVRILPGSIDISLIPLGAKLRSVQVAPKDEVRGYLSGASFETIGVVISPWQLMQGRLRLAEVHVDGAKIDASIPKSESNEPFSLDGIFSTLAKIPIHSFEISNMALLVKIEESKLDLVIDDLNLSLEKSRGNSLALELISGSVRTLKSQTTAASSSRVNFEASLLVSRESLALKRLKVHHGSSSIEASGKASGEIETLKIGNADFEIKSELYLDPLKTLVAGTFPSIAKNWPTLRGRVSTEASFKKSASQSAQGNFKVETEGLLIDQFLIDRVSVAGNIEHNGNVQTLTAPTALIDNPAGRAHVSDLKIESDHEKATFSGRLHSKFIQIHDLLKSLGVGEVPVYLQVSGDVPCQGSFDWNFESFNTSCKGQARGENLLVKAETTSKNTIVALREFDTEGTVSIDKDKVAYQAELKMPNSKGRSSGTIDYETGFKISYEGDHVSFKDVANLAHLKLEGTARVKGTTEGDSDSATLALEIDGNDFWLDDFQLGNAKSTVTYKAGHLNFSNLQGHYSVSRYAGEVQIDLLKEEVFVKARAPFFDTRDALKAFSRKVDLPFSVTGTGQAQITVSGPLAFNQLTYQLRTSVFRGTVASESFDQAHFDVTSQRGEVKADRVQITKGSSLISLTGTGHPDGSIKTVIRGRDIRLENSMIVSQSGLAVSGIVDFEMDMSGHVLSPDTDMRGRLTKTSIGDHGVPDSSFRLKFTSTGLDGEGVFLGDVLNAKFSVPFDTRSPFSLKMSSREWNFAPLFAAITGPSNRRDYESVLTSTISLAAPSGGFWNSSGSVQIDKFSLSRGSLALKSDQPLSLTMKNGYVQVGRFELAGENTFLKIAHNPNPVSKADLQVNGKLDMSLLALLTPFFEDLRGILSFAFNLRAGPETADLLGSAFVEKGHLKFFDFPHPIEDIRVDLIFNQKKILFNTMRAEIGGGRVNGSGMMELKGYKNYPVNVSGHFDKVTLNVPDQIRTSGSGNIGMSGNWFPFLLKVDYQVRDGLVTREFGGETADSGSLRREQFLPEFLLQERFVPLLVDLNIDFSKGIEIRNELIDGRSRGTLAVKGNPTKPSILGNITLDKDTKIMVKDTAFDVTSANIQFSDPNEMNPRLYVVARSRVQEYDVNLLVQGTASKPEFNFTSVPQLSEKEIVSLLALGTTETRATSVLQTGTQTSANSSPQISAGALRNNPLSKEIKEKTGFELQFDPGLDESAFVQRIVLKRQFTNKLGVTASQSLGNRRGSNAEVRYRLNDKVSGVLSWQSREETDTAERNTTRQETNQFGLDLEYKFEFK